MPFDMDVAIEDERIQELLTGIQDRLGHMRPGMRIIGETVRTSIVRNFEVGGRPKKWPLSKRAEEQGGQTLVDTARLKNSFTVAAGDDQVAVGTNDVRAPTLHFGADQGAFGTVTAQIRSHLRRHASGRTSRVAAHTRQMTLPWGDIPPREFMMIQDEDWPVIRQQLLDFLMGDAR